MLFNKSFVQKICILITLIFVLQTIKGDSLKVLFLGNSHTFWHDLPQLTADLALSNGDTIIFEANTPGGCTLGHPQNGHLYNSVSLAFIDSLDWDYVILQEHSLFAVIDYYRDTYMYPGAMSLDSLIKLNNNCTETIIQLIWGKKYGGEHCIYENCSIEFEDFIHMQDSLTTEYLRLGDTLSCTVAPSGAAWKQSILNGDPIELYDPDESHPSLAGSYLTACVYYAVLFQKTPVGLSYFGGLNSEDALYFQQIADGVVFENPDLWNINGNKLVAGFELTQIENTIYCIDTSVNAEHYFWDFGDGTTDTIQNPVHSYNASGTYIIMQEVSTLCGSDVTSDTIFVNLTTSSDNKLTEKGIKISRDNVSRLIQISSKYSKIHDISVYNIVGSVLLSQHFCGIHEYLLDISDLPSGLYILVVKSSTGHRTFKLSYR